MVIYGFTCHRFIATTTRMQLMPRCSGSGAECHGHANAPPSTALWTCTDADVAAMAIGSDTHKPAEMARRPIWQVQQGPVKLA